jgi:hypothetical protein
MEITAEEVMTGKMNVELVLQTNKDKIQSITSELEDIVRKGYLDILNNTETLINISNNETEWPKLILPSDIIIPEITETSIEKPLEDQIWDYIENSQFVLASELIIECHSNHSIQRIKAHLTDSYFYSIFEPGVNPEERIKSLAILQPKEESLIKNLIKFVCEQLVRKCTLSTIKDSYFNLASETIHQILSDKFLDSLNEKGYNTSYNDIPQEIESNLSNYIILLKTALASQIHQTTQIADLGLLITDSEPQFGIPTVWKLGYDVWIQHANELILSQVKLRLESDLEKTLVNYEAQTKDIAHLFQTFPQKLEDFKQELEKILPDRIFCGIPEDSDPILLYAFVQNISETSISKVFNLKIPEQEFIKKIDEKIKNMTIVLACHEIKRVCGNKLLRLPTIDVPVSECRRGFGQMLSLPSNQDCQSLFQMPSKGKVIEKLQLPSRFLQHLILN